MDADTGNFHTHTQALQVPEELLNFLKNGSNFIIAGHKEPDGDCVGSQLALKSALERTGKKAIVCSAGPFNRPDIKSYEKQFVDLKNNNPFPENSDTKAIIIDCTNISRTGEIEDIISKFPYAVIDHHASGDYPVSTPESPVFVDPNLPSCTLLIEKIIASLNLELTKEEAELLLLGLCTDTGFFRHLTEKNSAVFEAAAKIISCGANPKKIYGIINGGKSLNSRILLGRILSRTESFYNGRLLCSYETLEDFSEFGNESRDSDLLNQLLQSIEGVEATVLIRREHDNTYAVSLRSTDNIDVSKIASLFNGGGHMNASGFVIEGEYSVIKENILKEFSKFFI